jgi:hypothetical protein
MRRESRNWKSIKDKDLFEFVEGSEYLSVANPSDLAKCEDCSAIISTKENWQAFLKTSPILKGFGKGYNFRTTVEFYCQKCSE